MDDMAASPTKAMTSQPKRRATEMNGAHQEPGILVAGDDTVNLGKKRKVDNASSQGGSESAEPSSMIKPDNAEHPAQDQDDAAAKENPFQFLDLPPELRNMVYKLVLVRRYPAHNPSSRRVTPLPRPLNAGIQLFRDRHGICPALLATSRTIYHEARTLFWAQPFEFSHSTDLYKFLQEIGPRARVLLRDVTINWTAHAEEGDLTREENVTRLLDEAKQMRIFRLMVPGPFYNHQIAYPSAVQTFKTVLGKSRFARARVHSSSTEWYERVTYIEGRRYRVITTETWELNT